MVIRVFVSCCGADKAVAAAEEAVKQSGGEARIEVIKDLAEMVKAGVMSTPAYKIDDRLVASGRVPKVADLVGWLASATGSTAGR